MSSSKIYYRGTLGLVAAGVVTTLSAACGSSFGSPDCHETHTCMTAGGTDSTMPEAGAGSDTAPLGGEHGAIDDPPGGPGSAGGAGGAIVEPKPDCEKAADCDDGNRMNGLETCFSGKCIAGNAPPRVVGVTPSDGAVAAEPDGAVVIEFSETLDPTTAATGNIQILAGDLPVAGTVAYADKKVTFTPASPLSLLGSYKVVVTVGVKDTEGAPLLNAFESKFAVRDGAWKTIDVIKDQVSQVSDELPLSDTGAALVAWIGSPDGACSVSARWYTRGAPASPLETFDRSAPYCDGLTAAANSNGVATIVWGQENPDAGIYAAQYRNGSWSAEKRVTPVQFAYDLRAAVAPNGAVHFFDLEGGKAGPRAWRTDDSGTWQAKSDFSAANIPDSAANVGFDALGSGVAVWATRISGGAYSVQTSTFSTAAAKWSAPSALPGTSSDSPVSEPRIAVAPNGDAMVIWQANHSPAPAQIKASYFSGGTWSKPQSISSDLHDFGAYGSAARVVYDGARFVVAWDENEAAGHTDTLTFDAKTGWSNPETRQKTGEAATVQRSTRLGSDGHGTTVVVWATDANELVYQRYRNGTWTATTPIPGGAIRKNEDIAVGMNASGMIAVAWRNRDENGSSVGVRLASFY